MLTWPIRLDVMAQSIASLRSNGLVKVEEIVARLGRKDTLANHVEALEESGFVVVRSDESIEPNLATIQSLVDDMQGLIEHGSALGSSVSHDYNPGSCWRRWRRASGLLR